MSQETRRPCPRCGSIKVYKHSLVPNVKLGIKRQRFKCNDCGHSFF